MKKKIFNLIIGSLCCAIGYNFFMLENNFVVGDVSGLAIVVNKFLGIDINLFIMISTVVLIIIAVIFLEQEDFYNMLVGTILIPIFIYITSFIKLDLELTLPLSTVCAIALTGIGSGLIYKTGFSKGGSDIIALILYKNTNLSLATANILTDGFIVFLGLFVFGVNLFVYNLLILYITERIVDYMLIGISNSKLFYIITTKDKEIKKYLISKLSLGVTEIYTNNEEKCLLCLVENEKFYMVTRGVEKIDKNIVVSVSDAYETYGGFR